MCGNTAGAGDTGSGEAVEGFTGFAFFQYGAETEKLQQQLASEKGIHMQLQAEVRGPAMFLSCL
jgi:hypothetical protein